MMFTLHYLACVVSKPTITNWKCGLVLLRIVLVPSLVLYPLLLPALVLSVISSKWQLSKIELLQGNFDRDLYFLLSYLCINKNDKVMVNKNVPADYNVVCFLTKDGEFTPLSSLVVASFSKHCSFGDAMKEADKRTAPTIKALEMCHSVPWKCVVTIIHSGAYVKHLHRRYLINYENNELPF